MGQSRHFDSAPQTSALPRSADITDRVRQVRKVPTSEVGRASQSRLCRYCRSIQARYGFGAYLNGCSGNYSLLLERVGFLKR
jgi:hypothetical protein